MRWISRLAELFEDWSYLIKRDGWQSALPAVGRELVRLPYRHVKLAVVACSLLDPLPDLQSKILLEIREFKPTDLELVRHINCPSEARLCARRLAYGHKGLVALHKGEPAGYAWGCSEIEPTLERMQVELNSGDVLCVDACTAPVFRGQGVQTALTLARFRVFRDLGYRRAIAYIGTRNFASLATWQRKMGGEVVGYVDFRRIGPWRWVRFTESSNDPICASKDN